MIWFILAFLLLFFIAGTYIVSSQMTGREMVIKKSLHARAITYIEQQKEYNKYLINHIIIGDTNKPKVLLIHGSPGSWGAWEHILLDSSLLNRFCMIAYDRPGYGKTTVPAQDQLTEQAQTAISIINDFLKEGEQLIIVGHSYGGAVVEQLMIDYPSLVKKAVLVSPTLSPVLQEARWYNNLAEFKLINLLLPNDLKHSNYEMLGLSESLRKNEEVLKHINTRMVYIQGKKDILVPLETVDYFRSFNHDSIDYIIKSDMNHFVPWSHPKLIIDAIHE